MKPKRIVRLDASTLKLFKCPRQFYLTNVRGLVSKLGRLELEFGKGLHIFRAKYRGRQPFNVSRDAAIVYLAGTKSVKCPPRSMENLIACIDDYAQYYEVESDPLQPIRNQAGRYALEIPFSLPLYSTSETDVLLCGVIDEAATFGDDPRIHVVDMKHSATKYRDNHLDELRGSPQFMIYSYALKEVLGLDYYPPTIVDMVFISKTQEGAILRRTDSPVIENAPHLVERTISYAYSVAREVAYMLENNIEFPYNYGECIQFNRPCLFHGSCHTDKNFQEPCLDMLCETRIYNPEEF